MFEAIKPEAFEAVKLLLYIFAMIAVFLLIRTLVKIDASLKELFERMNNLSKDFYQLKGEHTAIKEHCLSISGRKFE